MTWKAEDSRTLHTAAGDVPLVVFSLAPHGPSVRPSDLGFLQHVRSGILAASSPTGQPEDAPSAVRYREGVRRFADALADHVAQGLAQDAPDLIIELPSSRDFNAPYTAAIKSRFPDAVDLTAAVRRVGNVRSGAGSSADAVLADTVIATDYNLSAVRTLVLIDDILDEGKTAGAVIARLREAGLPVRANISLAVPLVIVRP